MIIIIKKDSEYKDLLTRWKENTIGFAIFSFYIGLSFGYYWAFKVFGG
jgi:cytochrome c biogenesis factor